MRNITATQVHGLNLVVVPMGISELEDWDFVTDGIQGIGALRGYSVYLPDADGREAGVMFVKGRTTHVEYLDRAEGDYVHTPGSGRTFETALARMADAELASRRRHPVA